MKTLITKLLALMAVTLITLGMAALIAFNYETMWFVLTSVITMALIFYGIYRFTKWIFAEELEER